MSRVQSVDTVVQLSVSCKHLSGANIPIGLQKLRKLRHLDRFSHSDPMCVLYRKCGIRGTWSEVGRTEVIKNCGDPQWTTSFTLQYNFHEKQDLRFAVYDIDSESGFLEDHENLGTAECALAQILSADRLKIELNLSPYRTHPGDCGVLTVIAAELSDGTRDRVTLDLTAQNLDKKDLFSESDPFYCIYRTNEDGEEVLVYRSEWIRNTANPDWKPVTLDAAKLCGGDWNRPLRIEVYNWDADGGHDFIGDCTTNLDELSEGEGFQIVQYDLVNKKKVEKKRGYVNSGQIVLKTVSIEQDSTFLDYIRGGVRLNLVVGVDMTSSNGDPNSTHSLHSIDKRTGENAYTAAIRTVAEILQDYDYDKKLLGLGFGANIGGVVSHCFPLNGNSRSPYCRGVEDLIDNYKITLKQVKLSEPTRYSDLFQYTVDQFCSEEEVDEYTIVLLITDGGVTDFDETKEVLVNSSNLPLSVVLVGVGDGDMGALTDLDSDRARLCAGRKQAERDIVQFVHMKKFLPSGQLEPRSYHQVLDPAEARHKLARAVLAEIPRQVTEYYKKAGISPKLPDVPFDLSEDFDRRFNLAN
ncbi:copine-9 [Eurytemora carolleeae]|uniref:copine-9 n=1 Tax=Eurytemora carolleeae TaxID=1294199 RepID=UPI000C781665|nr:copine-9 [Eurytemora carolleeae]|eukprot:XP_023345926.1 copine-9-like [Eurytemora affinis]